MPAPISLAHKLCRQLTAVRKSGKLPYLRPDGKSQVTVEYDENGKPSRIDAVVISTQHAESVSNEELHADILKYVIQAVLPAKWLDEHTKYHINPDGTICDRRADGRHRPDRPQDHRGHLRRRGPSRRRRLQRQGPDQGGPLGSVHGPLHRQEHCGRRTGRARRGPAGLRHRRGRAGERRVDTFGTGKVGDAKLTELVRKNFSLTPKGIIESLNLRRPIYQKTAAYGHFGRTEPEFTWEATDKAAALAEQAGLAAAAK